MLKRGEPLPIFDEPSLEEIELFLEYHLMNKCDNVVYLAWGLSISRTFVIANLPFAVEAIIDNSPSFKIDPWTNLPTLLPNDLSSFDPNRTKIVVIADIEKSYRAILKQAKALGHYNIAPFTDYFSKPNDYKISKSFTNFMPFKGLRCSKSIKKVAVLLWDTVVGGAERQAILLTEGFEQVGVAVEIIYCICSNEEQIVSNCHFLLTRSLTQIPKCDSPQEKHIYDSASSIVYPLTAFLSAKLYSKLEILEPDALFVYLDAPMICASIAGKFFGINSVVYRGWLAPPDHLPPPFLNCEYNAARCILRSTIGNGRATLVVDSDLGVVSYNKWLGVNTLRIPNAVETPISRRATGKSLSLFSAKKTHAWIVTAMRLVPQKNPQYFIKLIRGLYETGLLIRGTIFGDGLMRQDLESLICDNQLGDMVDIAGFKSDFREILHTADLFILPSHFEGMSSALMEACASEIPFVASRNLGTLNAIPHYLHDWLVDLANEKLFLEKAIDALSGKFLYIRDEQEKWLAMHSKKRLATRMLGIVSKKQLSPL
jgi:glycosyltransferase involved in cell wall biosynthesis